MLPPQSYITVYKQRTTPFIDYVLNSQNDQMGDTNGQMDKYLKVENGQIGKQRNNWL